nr:class I SAM-dependent methyltransferase [Pseudonocardia sp. ICBG1293]
MPTASDPATFWDELYRRRDDTEPRANPLLTEVAGPLAPGTALDLGCGGGGDTMWLARRGWHVTAVDISATAVDGLRRRAHAHGLAARIRTERHDLATTFPDGTFDLVSAQYLHTPFALDRDAVLRTAARALRPGGSLLVVDHGSVAPWSWNQDPDTRHPGAAEVAAGLDLDPEGWTVERADEPRRRATGPDGRTATVVDTVLVLRRAGAAPSDRS